MHVLWFDRRVTWAGAVGSALDGLVGVAALAGMAVVAAVMLALILAGMLAEAVVDARRRPSRKVPR